MTAAGPLQLTILEDFEHVDDTLDDAAWWDRYTIKAGRYEVMISGDEAEITADATLVEEYRTTRLMNRNKAEAKAVYEETTFTFRPSAAEAVPGPLSLAGTYGWLAPEGSPVPTPAAIAEVVADLRAATNARRTVGTETGFEGSQYAEALTAEAQAKARVVERAQATA